MSLASSPDFQIRPEDKALDSLFLADGDPLTGSFNDYLTENYDLSDSDHKETTFEDFFEFFEKEATANGGTRPPIGGSARHDAPSPQPWRQGLWCLNQKEALSSEDAWTDSSAPNVNQNVPNTRHHHRHRTQEKPYMNFSRPNPRSPPRTPPQKGTKRQSATSPKAARKSPYERQAFSREGTLSPRSTYARNQHNNGMAYQELLQQHLQNFHLPMQDDGGLQSPAPPGQQVREVQSTWMNAPHAAQNGGIQPNLGLITSIENQDTVCPSARREYSNLCSGARDPPPFKQPEHLPLYPGLANPSFASNTTDTIISPTEHILNEAAYLPDSQDSTAPRWSKEHLVSALEPGYLYDMPTHLSPGGQSQAWWSPQPNSVAQPDAPHSYPEIYPMIAAPTPQRPTHQILQNQASPHLPGLGIHYPAEDPSAPTAQACPALSPVEPTYQYPPLPQVEPLPPSLNHTFSNASPFSTPQRHHQPRLSPASPSPSPSVSPTDTNYNQNYTDSNTNYASTSRSLRIQTSPTRSSNRRKSIGAPKASSFNTHHSSKSTQAAPRTPKTPKTSTTGFTGGGSVVDFVNFTPKDSAKLLSDVAPSGSSKTRARREQEARDKRRRMSEAAVKVVRRAAKASGGDVGESEVEALKRAILA